MNKSEAGKLGAINSVITSKRKREENIRLYLLNPKICPNCAKVIDYDKKKQTFCSHSCGATYLQLGGKAPTKGFCVVCGSSGVRHKMINGLYCDTVCRDTKKHEIFLKSGNDGTCSPKKMKSYWIRKTGNNCMDPNCIWDQSKRPVFLELDHINGDSTNNSFQNTRILCPNCHSLTDTYKGKNNGNGRYRRRLRYQEGKSF